MNGQTGAASLILQRVEIAGAGTLVGSGASGVAATNLAAVDVTLGGTGTTAGAATQTAGDALLQALAVETLDVAARDAIQVADAAIGASLATAGASVVSLERVSFGPGATTRFDDVADALSLHRVHAQGTLTVEVEGDIRLGLVRAEAEGGQAGTLSLTSRAGGIAKLADADIDYAGDGDGVLRLDLGPGGARAIAAAGSGAFDDLLRVDGDLVASAFEDVLLTEGAAADGARRVSVGGSAAFSVGGDLAVTASGALDLAEATVGGDSFLRVVDRAVSGDGDLTQSGDVAVTGRLTLATGGDALLTSQANAFLAVSGEVEGAAAFGDADGFALRDLRAGALTVAGQAGAVTLSDVAADAALSIEAETVAADRVSAGTLSLSATGGDLRLTDAQAGETRLSADGALTAERFRLGDFSAESGGALRLADGQGGSTLPAGIAAGADLDASGLRLGAATLTAAGAVRLEAIAAAALVLEANGGALDIADVETAGGFIASATGAIVSLARADGSGGAVTVNGPRAASLGEAISPRLGDPTDGRGTVDLAAVGDAGLAAVPVSPGLVVGGEASLTAGDGVELPQGAGPGGATNRFVGDLALDVTGDAAIDAAGAVTLGAGRVTGDLVLRSNADGADASGAAGIGQSGAVSVGGKLDLATGSPEGAPAPATLADIVLEDAGNAFGEVTLAARDARLRDVDGFAVRRSTLGGDLVIGEGAAQAGSVTLQDVSAGTATLTAVGDVDVERVAVDGRLELLAGGSLSLRDGAAGRAAVEAGGDLAIDRARVGADGALTAGGGLAIADLDVRGDLTAAAGGALEAARVVVGGDVDATSGEAMNLAGLSAGGALILTADRDGSAAGPAAARLTEVSAASLSLEAGGAADLDATTLAADASVLTRLGDIRLGTLDVGGDGRFQAQDGAIRSRAGSARAEGFAAAAPLGPAAPQGVAGVVAPEATTRRQVAGRSFETLVTIGGDAWFDASGDVLLPGDGALENDFVGGVTVSRGARVALSDANDLTLGAPATTLPNGEDAAASGIFNRVEGERIAALRVEVGGTLQDTAEARVRVSGDAWLQAGRDVRLASGRHDVGGSLGAQGRDVELRMRGDVRLGPVRARRDFTVQANARDGAESGFIRQTSALIAPELVMEDGVAAGGDRAETGPVEVGGATDISTGAPAARPLQDLNGRGEVVLDDRRNRFDGPVALRRIFGDVVLVEEATEGLVGRDGADGGRLRLRNVDAAGDVLIRTSDDVIFLGRLTALQDDDRSSPRPSISTSETAEERRAQGRATLADADLRLYIADGKRLTVDATAGGVDAAGGDIRFDRPVDGANDLIGRRTTESAAARQGLGSLVLDAGREGHVRVRDFVGAGHPIDRFRIREAGDVSLGHTFADRSPGENTREGRFLLGRGAQERDVLIAALINIDAHGNVELYVSDVTFELYDDADEFFGVNTLTLRFGETIEPETLTLFGFITDSGKRAAGVFAKGPDVDEQDRFTFNGCNAGDVVDCARLTQPSVLEIVRIDQAQILNVDEEDLLELFVSYGNEELWGVPPGYFLDVDVSAARASGNQQAVQPPVSNVVTAGRGAADAPTTRAERVDR
ncbi:MAG: hypothetical protein AAGI51_00570 [Pseudomonadota bacterium]